MLVLQAAQTLMGLKEEALSGAPAQSKGSLEKWNIKKNKYFTKWLTADKI